MGATRANVGKQGMVIQAGLVEIGAVPDLSPAEITAHQETLDRLIARIQAEADNQSVWDEESVRNSDKWKDNWALCDSVMEIGIAKAPDDAAKAVMERAAPSGGWSLSRARKFATKIRAALERYPENFTVKGKTKAQILAALQEGFDSDNVLAAAISGKQAAQADIRVLVPAIDAENDRILRILDVDFDPGTREAEIVIRMHIKTPAAKKTAQKDPPK